MCGACNLNNCQPTLDLCLPPAMHLHRMCGEPVTAELMAAVLGRQRLGGKKEVVMVPAAGSFFAYEPILKALQATHPLPLAKYILYDQNTTGTSSVRQPLLLRGQLVGGSSGTGGRAGAVDVSALRCVSRRDRMPCDWMQQLTVWWHCHRRFVSRTDQLPAFRTGQHTHRTIHCRTACTC